MNEDDYLNFEGDNEFIQVQEENLIRTLKKWCDEAYNLLQEQPLEISSEEDRLQTILALRRMLGLYIDQEEYEKCVTIKKIIDEKFKKESDLSPLFDYKKA
jgi:uncharacterized coiled-coil DUF342 family protein